MAGAIFAEVQSDMALGEVHRLGGAVERIDTLSSCPKGIDGEASCIAEGIEHGASLGILTYELSILSLIDEEARLLSLEPVGDEA